MYSRRRITTPLLPSPETGWEGECKRWRTEKHNRAEIQKRAEKCPNKKMQRALSIMRRAATSSSSSSTFQEHLRIPQDLLEIVKKNTTKQEKKKKPDTLVSGSQTQTRRQKKKKKKSQYHLEYHRDPNSNTLAMMDTLADSGKYITRTPKSHPTLMSGEWDSFPKEVAPGSYKAFVKAHKKYRAIYHKDEKEMMEVGPGPQYHHFMNKRLGKNPLFSKAKAVARDQQSMDILEWGRRRQAERKALVKLKKKKKKKKEKKKKKKGMNMNMSMETGVSSAIGTKSLDLVCTHFD
jgi:hypothetical protein